MKSFGVIGGGVLGLCSALELLEAGQKVVLIDDDRDGRAPSWNNAGHIAVEQVEPLASAETVRTVPGRLFMRGGPLALPIAGMSAWLPFGFRLLMAARPERFRDGAAALRGLLEQAMPAWNRMANHINRPDLLRQNGHFVLWQNAREAKARRAFWRAVDTGTAQVRDVTASEIGSLSILCGQSIAGAVHFSGSGQIADLDALREALRIAFVSRGGVMLSRSATIRRAGNRAEVPGLDVDGIVLCAGVRSRKWMEVLGHKVPMIAERGYHIRADAARWPEDLPPIVFEERSMIVTRFTSSVQAAGFVELGNPEMRADPRKWERLERNIAELGLPISGPFRRWMGCRPTLPDYLPAIGQSNTTPNLYYAFGHQHLGLTLAPVTARLISAAVSGAAPEFSIAPFDIQRFG